MKVIFLNFSKNPISQQLQLDECFLNKKTDIVNNHLNGLNENFLYNLMVVMSIRMTSYQSNKNSTMKVKKIILILGNNLPTKKFYLSNKKVVFIISRKVCCLNIWIKILGWRVQYPWLDLKEARNRENFVIKIARIISKQYNNKKALISHLKLQLTFILRKNPKWIGIKPAQVRNSFIRDLLHQLLILKILLDLQTVHFYKKRDQGLSLFH